MNEDKYVESDLTTLMTAGISLLIRELHEHLDELGFGHIRPAHGYLFKRITPDGATGIEISEYLGITKQAVSKIVDHLEENGYVQRTNHPTDMRGKLIVLTERGKLAIQAKEKIVAEIEARWAQRIGVERMDLLKKDLTTLVEEANGGQVPRGARPVW
ncbi:MarR family transcriptional regulator [Paenibacillus sp. SC116]|uniref:MarR family winged helix-turn-helix transcriptional regulator n=1 Tax=Paenibacillus sp. SC116 TaxID=2968986 RepID=UPI00215B2357|nr:MarR family transcriptional regulator [Paenibacillus sp. SC116]MCR8842297.1 MarR family transcriptional regulator [Paenibacillus sp. SC116]